MGKYLIKGSILRCDKGEKESKFNPDKKTVSVQGKPVGTTKDCKAGVHVKDFKGCALAGECKLATELMGKNLKWEKFREKTTIEGHNVITDESICRCPIGGIISVIDSTQVEGSAEKNALLEQIEDVMSQAIQKVTNDMIAIRNDLGYGDKKLGISEKMKIYRTFEKQNPYYKNFENLFGREQKSIMQEKVLDEVLYQVRTEEGYTWMTKRDTLLFVLILFMLFNVLDSENVLMLPVMFGVVEIVGGVGIGAAGGSGALVSALAGGVAGILLAVVVIVVVKSLSKNNEAVESSNASENVGDISLGSTGYVQGVDGLGIGSYQEGFDIMTMDDLLEIDNLLLQLQIAMTAKEKDKVIAIVDELNDRFKKKDISFENYIKYNVNGYKIYVGITSGIYENIGDPIFHVYLRDIRPDHMFKNLYEGFEYSILDKSTKPTLLGANVKNKSLAVATLNKRWRLNLNEKVYDYMAHKGREQILIDEFGGIGSPYLRNEINSISEYPLIRRKIFTDTAYEYWGKDSSKWKIPTRDAGMIINTGNRITVKELRKKLEINYQNYVNQQGGK